MSIQRIDTGKRLSHAVVHNNTVYLCGMVGKEGTPFEEQIRQVLADIDDYLAQAGSDKTKLLNATIWIDDFKYFDQLNAAWEAWLPEGCAPARATGQVKLASPGWLVEIIVTAAI
ncbi:RidA family protein [Govanella unica]|uniref:RidA family protein n=1 Tax=Govanella unica TaxID=2975056 RepID=A0A9X3Z7H0_9PROT|nr:RidA family protein [Govania unica]MDA5194147.1 RidA family protein [Govania unica]